MVSMLLVTISPFLRHDKAGSFALRPVGEWMTRTLALAEMPEIDHRVRQTFQGVVQPTDPFKAQQ